MAIKLMTTEEIRAEIPNPSQAETLCGHTSDNGFYIRKIGTDEEYRIAIDLLPCAYEYEETDIPLPEPEPEIEAI